jgi:hypothetical protein
VLPKAISIVFYITYNLQALYKLQIPGLLDLAIDVFVDKIKNLPASEIRKKLKLESDHSEEKLNEIKSKYKILTTTEWRDILNTDTIYFARTES